jgi:membrane-associated phospholipid phosphatase
MDRLDDIKLNNNKFFLKIFPIYSILPTCLYIFIYVFSYFVPGFIIVKYHLKIHYLSSLIDNYIPYVSLFVIPYFIFYLYIFLAPILVSRYSEYLFYRFILAGIIGSLIGAFTFLIKPTYIVIPNLVPTNFLDHILIFLRSCDYPGRCCPSFHCFLSALIFIAIFSIQNIKSELKIKSFIISFFIILSTLFTKQHVIVDVFAGILLAIISWNLAKNNKYIESLKKIFKKIDFLSTDNLQKK